MHKTKIICTIGPATSSQLMIANLLKLGMNVARLNLTYGTHIEHQKTIYNVREAIKNTGIKCGIMLDLEGPVIKTMKLINSKPVRLKKNSIFTLSMNKNVIGNEKIVAINYTDLIHNVTINQYILINDGLIQLKVIKIGETQIDCVVLNNCLLEENQIINIPGINLPIKFLSKKDKKDIAFACKNNVDFLGVSLVRNIEDILHIRLWLNHHEKSNIQLIVKIETAVSLTYLDDIINLSEADVIMISRRNLGFSLPLEQVVIEQKKIIEKCKKVGKCVIIASQMLHSMKYYPIPTRAEISDVTNAVIDGTDALMLSDETANGIYPIESLKFMCKICKTAEDYTCNQNLKPEDDTSKMALVIFSIDGSGINKIRTDIGFNKFKKILIITKEKNNKLMLMKGVTNYYKFDYYNNNYILTDYYDIAQKLVVKLGICKKEDYIFTSFDVKDTNDKPLGKFAYCYSVHMIK